MELLRKKLGDNPNQINNPDTTELFNAVRDELLASVDIDLFKKKTDKQVQQFLKDRIAQITRKRIGAVPGASLPDTIKQMTDDILGYGPITDLLNDPEISEVMVNRYDTVFYEKKGKLWAAPDVQFRSEEHLMRVIRRIVDDIGRRIDESSPMVDARLPDGSRINAIIPPISPDGAGMTIRKFKPDFSKEDLVNFGTIPERYLPLLEACVKARVNILVTGGTGTGKTSLLNVLCNFVDPEERIITIEDDLELSIKRPHLVRMESRAANTEGKGRVRIRDLVINSLRMRPDRLIVGEVRGEEALDMLHAMNTGHDGSMTTAHANSPEDALTRLEAMVKMAENLNEDAVRSLIASGINLIIHLTRFPEDGSRKITKIIEVVGVKNKVIETREILRFERDYRTRGVVDGEFKLGADPESELMKRLRYYGSGDIV